MKLRTCRLCKKEIKGRTDKIFCSIGCKNEYHTKLRKVTTKETQLIDSILHRNRAILLEIMGKYSKEKLILREVLDNKKFNYKYHTHTYLNKNNKLYKYVYDFGWMEFSNQKVLIIRQHTQ